MELGKISYDSWASHESIQILQGQGYDAELLSVDTTAEPYATPKEAIYDGRFSVITFQNSKRNCSDCNMTGLGTRSTTDSNGSKDLADALAGAV